MLGLDDFGRRWEQLAPRERRLLVAFGLAFVLCIFGYLGWLIRGGLNEIETRNAELGQTLKTLVDNREQILEQRNAKHEGAGVLEEALATYLDGIATEVGVTIPESTERTAVKGKFTERIVDIKLRSVSVQQLADFLQKVETRSTAVVTLRLFVKPYFNQHDKLDVEMSVATYERQQAKSTKGASEGDDGGVDRQGTDQEHGG